MYPQQELNWLSARKIALRRDIAHRRLRCAEDAAQATRPLEWLDRVIAFWRRISPLADFAAVPLGLLVQRIVAPRLKILRFLVRWSPLVFGAVHFVGARSKPRATPPESPDRLPASKAWR